MATAKPESKKRLLIIDDDADLLDLFRTYMEREGYLVAVAEDGLIGVEKAKSFKPDIIVLDLMMPNLNGFETLHRLQQEHLTGIPVIIITAYSQTSNEQLIRQEPNVVEFVPKPLRYADMAALIRRVLEKLPGSPY